MTNDEVSKGELKPWPKPACGWCPWSVVVITVHCWPGLAASHASMAVMIAAMFSLVLISAARYSGESPPASCPASSTATW